MVLVSKGLERGQIGSRLSAFPVIFMVVDSGCENTEGGNKPRVRFLFER